MQKSMAGSLRLSVALALLATHSASALADVVRIDFGTDSSPVANGYRRVTAESRYDKKRGFGWVGARADRYDFYRTAISDRVFWKLEHSATVVDGVASKRDLIFRLDLPNGRYTVELLLGDPGGRVPAGRGRFLDTGVRGKASGGPGGPLYSMAVSSKERLVARNVETRTYPHRARVSSAGLLRELGVPISDRINHVRLGNYTRIRFSENIRDGKLLLRLHGNETAYRAAVTLLKRASASDQRKLMHTAGGPFVRNSVLAMTVRPFLEAPFVLSGGKLKLGTDVSPRHQKLVDAFNAGEFAKLTRVIRALSTGSFPERRTRLLAWMWLTGHPDFYDERKLLPVIAREIEAATKSAAPAQKGELASLRGTLLDFQRGMMNFDQRTRDGQQVVTCMNRAEGCFQRSQPFEPFYWKSQLYRARIWYGMDPNRRGELWPKAEAIVRTLAKVYPRNRWVRYYLHADASGWPLADYRKRAKGAPEWAIELRNYHNRMLDLCEWWVINRQQKETGALGGEWGDDVEFMPLIAYTGFICPDASPSLLTGTRRFCNGLWERSGIVDTHNGFFHLTSDAEHSAEFTGNVLGMMLHVNPGDPVALERALKTGKLMRDLWTARNPKGLRLFRSSYLGAFHTPHDSNNVDSAICGRAIIPALHVLEYNRNPEIGRLVVEYADTLLKLANSTAKGKPRGVLPGPIVFATGELGHVGSKQWWLAPPGPYQKMFSFPRYHGFRHRILTTAWKVTGDAKYLKPIAAEAGLALRFEKVEVALARPGSVEWVGKQLGRIGVRELWQQLEATTKRREPANTGALLDTKTVAAEAKRLADVANRRWPMMTDDAIMTDRVAFRGCVNSTVWYCGARVSAQQIEPAVSYEGPGRDFAALVQRHNPRYVKLLYYGFHDKPCEVKLRFWELQSGGEYRITVTSGSNGENTLTKKFTLREAGDGTDLRLVHRQTFVIEVTPVRPGKRTRNLPDPAISASDIRYDSRGHLLIDVHNIGNRPATDVAVDFYDGDPARGGKRLGRSVVSHVEPPNRLQPQVVRTGIEWKPNSKEHRIFVVLDAGNRIDELSEGNNMADSVIAGRK